MRLLSIPLILVAGTFLRAASAAEVAIPATTATIVTTQEGKSQIVVLMSRPEILDHVALGDVRLRLSRPIEARGSDRGMQIEALRAAHVSGEPNVHEGLRSRVAIEEGSSTGLLDLSNLIRGVLHEEEFYGLLVTRGETVADGFESADAQELLLAFQGATLEIQYRRIPPPPRTRRS